MNKNSDLEKLLSVATGPAVDLLFKKLSNFERGILEPPSSGLVLDKWRKLSAESASTLATSLKDPDLIDSLLYREKRKTVRRAFASNRNLSRVSRLFLFQSALSSDDYDLAKETLSGFEVEEILIMLKEDSNINRFSNQDLLINSGLLDLSDERVKSYISSIDTRSFEILVNKAIVKNFSYGLRLLRLGEVTNFKYSSYTRYDFQNLDLKMAEEFLNFLAKPDRNAFLSTCWEKRPEIFFSLKDENKEQFLTSLREISPETLKLFNNTLTLSEVILKNKPVFSNIGDAEARLLFSPQVALSARVYCALCLPEKASVFFENNELETLFQISLKEEPLMLAKWLEEQNGAISLEDFIVCSENLPKKCLNNRFLAKGAKIYNITVEDLILKLSDCALANLESFPKLDNYEKVFARLESVTNLNLPSFYEQVLDRSETGSLFSFSVAQKLVDLDPDRLTSWLGSLENSEETKVFLENNKKSLLPIVEKSVRLMNKDWAPLFVEEITLRNGLYSINSETVLKAIFDYLDLSWGKDSQYWESGIGLLGSWDGSVSDLAKAVKAI